MDGWQNRKSKFRRSDQRTQNRITSSVTNIRVKVLAPAKKDLCQGFSFYEQQAPGVGVYFINTLSLEMMELQFTADIYSKRGNLFRVKSKKFPYWIYYTIKDVTVYVIMILDARRSLVVIHQREKREQEFFF